MIAKTWESGSLLSPGTFQLTGYFPAVGICLCQSAIRKVKLGLLETFHGTFATKPHMEAKRFSTELVQAQIESFSKDHCIHSQVWEHGAGNCISLRDRPGFES